jgi:peptidoglycan/xylan/chitin deacetylase (PgdA/CDA1 family)
MNQSYLFKILQMLATVACGLGKRKKLFILIYHRVYSEPDFMNPNEVDKTAFSWQMALLSKYFQVLPLYDAIQKLKSDTLPPRAVCITFDDGYADNYTNALPILQRFNLPAIFFIANGYLDGGRMWNDTIIEAVRNYKASELDLSDISLGRFDVSTPGAKSAAAGEIIKSIKHLPPEIRQNLANFIAEQSPKPQHDLMMSSDQLKKLHASGMEIGGHTVSHPILAKLDADSAWLEIYNNKIFLENLLGEPLRLFAYPNGKPGIDYLVEQIPLVSKAGYAAAVSTVWGSCNASSDTWQLPRFTPWDKKPLYFMLRLIKMYFKK